MTDMLLVNTNAAHALMALLFSGAVYNAVQRFPEAMIRHAQKVSNLSNRKLFGQGNGKGFKQQGKATTGVGPAHLNLSGLSTAAGNARKCRVDESIVLKEVKMLPGTGFPIMDGLISFPTNRTRKAFLSTDDIKMDLSLIEVKTNIIHSPWEGESKGRGKQVSRVHHAQFSRQSEVINSSVHYHDFPH